MHMVISKKEKDTFLKGTVIPHFIDVPELLCVNLIPIN